MESRDVARAALSMAMTVSRKTEQRAQAWPPDGREKIDGG